MRQFGRIRHTTLIAAATGAALLAGGAATASARTKTIVLDSGGTPLAAEGAPDSATTWTDENFNTTGQALGSCTAPGWVTPLAKTEWISADDACGASGTHGGDTLDYDTSIVLPANITKGSIKVKMAAAGEGFVLFNGYQFGGGVGDGAFATYTVSTKNDADLFEEDNTLDVKDGYTPNFPYGVDYKATITYTVPVSRPDTRR